MTWGILLPLIIWGVERFLTARGLKKKVPAIVGQSLEEMAKGYEGKVPPAAKVALDSYVSGQVKSNLEQMVKAGERIEKKLELGAQLIKPPLPSPRKPRK